MWLPDLCQDITIAKVVNVTALNFCIFASSFHYFVIYVPGFPAGDSFILYSCCTTLIFPMLNIRLLAFFLRFDAYLICPFFEEPELI